MERSQGWSQFISAEVSGMKHVREHGILCGTAYSPSSPLLALHLVWAALSTSEKPRAAWISLQLGLITWFCSRVASFFSGLVSASLLCCITRLLRTSTSWQLSSVVPPPVLNFKRVPHPPPSAGTAGFFERMVSRLSPPLLCHLGEAAKRCLVPVLFTKKTCKFSTRRARFGSNIDLYQYGVFYRWNSHYSLYEFLMEFCFVSSSQHPDRIRVSLQSTTRKGGRRSTWGTGDMSTAPAELPSLWSNAFLLWLVL